MAVARVHGGLYERAGVAWIICRLSGRKTAGVVLMPALLDYGLVIGAVTAAAAFLWYRKLRSLKKISRDWSTGHSEICDSCPAIKIREAQVKHTSKS